MKNTLEDVSPGNYQAAGKEKEFKIMELRKEIRDMKANINDVVQEKRQLYLEDVIAKFYNKLQLEELLKRLISCSKESRKLDSKELGKARVKIQAFFMGQLIIETHYPEPENKAVRESSLTHDRTPGYPRNDGSKEHYQLSTISSQDTKFMFDDKHMEGIPNSYNR